MRLHSLLLPNHTTFLMLCQGFDNQEREIFLTFVRYKHNFSLFQDDSRRNKLYFIMLHRLTFNNGLFFLSGMPGIKIIEIMNKIKIFLVEIMNIFFMEKYAKMLFFSNKR